MNLILTITDRLSYLDSQLESINNQTSKSDVIIHWNNQSEYNLDYPSVVYRNKHKSEPLYNRFISSTEILPLHTYSYVMMIYEDKNIIQKCLEFWY